MVVKMVAVNGFCGYGDVLSYCCGLRGGLAVLLASVCQWRRMVAGLAAATAMGQGGGAKTKVSHSPVAGRMADCDSYGLKLLLNLLGVVCENLLLLSGFGLGHLDSGE